MRFFASEAYYPFTPIPCPNFDHVILLCEPIHRLFSRAFRLHDPNRTVRALLERTVVHDPQNTSLVKSIMPSFAGTASFNNPMIRILLGPRMFRAPLGGITRRHYQAAVQLLQNFTLVVPTEKLSDPRVAHELRRRYRTQAAKRVPWRSAVMPHLNSKRWMLPPGASLSRAVWDLIRFHNRWDVALHRHAVARFESVARSWEPGL